MQPDLITPIGSIAELWPTAPNPKPSSKEKRVFGRFTNTYAAFSEDFANFALETLLRHGSRTIWDPFAGSGTLGMAARKRACHVILGDINPYSSLCSLVRTARLGPAALATEVAREVAAKTPVTTTVWDWTDTFLSKLGLDRSWLKSTLIGPITNLADIEQAALILFFGVTSYQLVLARNGRGSNPAWINPQKSPPAGEHKFSTAALNTHFDTLARYLVSLGEVATEFLATVATHDAIRDPLPQTSVDAIVTSPPYLNRLDHFMQFAPAAAPVLDLLNIDTDAFRALQMGTPRIREKTEGAFSFPKDIHKILGEIRSHPSYASARYYYWGYYYYFSDMQEFLLRAAQALRPEGYLIMVVQSSYYKDIRIDLNGLLLSLAESFGFRPIAVRDWNVNKHLGQISPRQPRKNLIETATVLRKTSSQNPAR